MNSMARLVARLVARLPVRSCNISAAISALQIWMATPPRESATR